MMMKTAALLVLAGLLTAAVLLAATNPTTAQYAAFLDGQLEQALGRMEPDGISSSDSAKLRQVLRTQGRQILASLLKDHTVRTSYGLFSLFETDALGVRIRTIGAARHFFPLDDRDVLAAKLGRLIF